MHAYIFCCRAAKYRYYVTTYYTFSKSSVYFIYCKCFTVKIFVKQFFVSFCNSLHKHCSYFFNFVFETFRHVNSDAFLTVVLSTKIINDSYKAFECISLTPWKVERSYFLAVSLFKLVKYSLIVSLFRVYFVYKDKSWHIVFISSFKSLISTYL